MVGHADGGKHAVDRKDDVEQSDHADGAPETARLALVLVLVVHVDFVVDFLGGLEQQEQSAEDQNDVAARKIMAEDRQQGLVQVNQPEHAAQQRQTEHHRQSEAETRGLGLLPRRQALRRHGDENEIVDAQDNFQRRQRQQAEPSLRLGKNL